MAAKIKPIEPTVIKDKKIVREVIAQARQKPTAEDVKWIKWLSHGFCLSVPPEPVTNNTLPVASSPLTPTLNTTKP
jgi:hypothetical protein